MRYSRRKQIQLLETATERIGRMLSENYGIRVVHKAGVCCTNGKTIFLPVLGENASDELLGAVPGMIDHEAGHVLDSDFNEVKNIKKFPDGAKLHGLVNACEDARIEKFMVHRWRGIKVNLRRLHDWGYKKLLSEWDNVSEWGKFVQICGVIACQENDYWAVKEIQQREPELWFYGEKVRDLLEQAADAPDTKTAVKLAREILDRIYNLADPPPPPEEDQDDNGDGQGSSENDQEDLEDSNNDAGDQNDEGESDGGAGNEQDDKNGEDQESKTGGNCFGDGDTSDPGEGEPSDVPECLKRDYQPSKEEQENDEAVSSRQNQLTKEAKESCPTNRGQYLIYSTERDVIETANGGCRRQVLQLLSESRHITHTMKQKMMRNLVALTRSRWEANHDRGRINPRTLHRVVAGTSKKVFRKKVAAPKFNTRCSLWIDHSGSMSGDKLKLAAASALLFGEVLNQLGIPFEVCGFSTSTSHEQGEKIYMQASHEDRMTYSRFGGLWVGVYKAFEEDWNLVKSRCADMRRNQRHNTYDGESVRLAAQRLLSYPEKRRILFLFNDGHPCPNVANVYHEHVAYAKSVASSVEKMVEVFAIGIKTDDVADIYSNAVCIRDLEDLPKVMLGELDRLLKNMQRQLMRVA